MTNFLHDLAALLARELYPIDVVAAWPTFSFRVITYSDGERCIANDITGEAFALRTI